MQLYRTKLTPWATAAATQDLSVQKFEPSTLRSAKHALAYGTVSNSLIIKHPFMTYDNLSIRMVGIACSRVITRTDASAGVLVLTRGQSASESQRRECKVKEMHHGNRSNVLVLER